MNRAEYDEGAAGRAQNAELVLDGVGRIDLSDELPSWCASKAEAPRRRSRML